MTKKNKRSADGFFVLAIAAVLLITLIFAFCGYMVIELLPRM